MLEDDALSDDTTKLHVNRARHHRHQLAVVNSVGLRRVVAVHSGEYRFNWLMLNADTHSHTWRVMLTVASLATLDSEASKKSDAVRVRSVLF